MSKDLALNPTQAQAILSSLHQRHQLMSSALTSEIQLLHSERCLEEEIRVDPLAGQEAGEVSVECSNNWLQSVYCSDLYSLVLSTIGL